MRVVVLGGTGEMGGRVADLLAGRGHDVVRSSRATGADVTEPGSLVEVLRGADCVVDCLNVATLSKRRAVDFFTAAAQATWVTANTVGVPHVVAVSIVNVTDPAVARSTGYYAGKAAQEAAYAAAPLPVTVVRTTAWFTLAATFLRQLRVGSVAVVPRMGLRPVHPDAAAALVADTVEAGPTSGPAATEGPATREFAGPEETDSASMARALVAATGSGERMLALPAPVTAMRQGLLPAPGTPSDDRRFADWLPTLAGGH